MELVAMTFGAYSNRGTMQPCYAAFPILPACQLCGTSYLERRTGFRESITCRPTHGAVLDHTRLQWSGISRGFPIFFIQCFINMQSVFMVTGSNDKPRRRRRQQAAALHIRERVRSCRLDQHDRRNMLNVPCKNREASQVYRRT